MLHGDDASSERRRDVGAGSDDQAQGESNAREETRTTRLETRIDLSPLVESLETPVAVG
ncbi:hypothetical protein Halxa_3198 [Halopiger xanaduensis SH-6]|uniref:Uncharacterized protein n=1 Tax=Halopiger xanaduensis (strain DSM 18323 / JCM 14033 / SH-6) TaxID=797210 RepID=F8D6R4_HALXS|nr:hypothetical protein Halxa_3198 [Halopiger xanaduensis SH-6]